MRPGQYSGPSSAPQRPGQNLPAGGARPPVGNNNTTNKPSMTTTKTGQRRLDTGNAKALADLHTGLRNNAKFGKMVMYSVECVGKMATDQTSVEEIAESGCIAASLDACMLSKNNEALQNQLNKTLLRSAGINDSCTVTISQAIDGNFKCFKNSIDNHSTDETLTSTAEVLKMLATAPEPEGELNRKRMKEQGLYESLSQKIASGSVTDPNTLAALTQALATGASDHDVAQDIIDQGVFQELMKMMDKHPNNVALARAFAELANQASKAGQDIVDQLKALGVDLALSKLLTKFPHDKALLDSIAGAMEKLGDKTDIQPLVQILAATNQKTADGTLGDAQTGKKLEATAQLNALTMVSTNLDAFNDDKNINTILASQKALINDVKHYNSDTNQNSEDPEVIPIPLVDAVTQTSSLLSNIAAHGGDKQRDALINAGGVELQMEALQELRKAYDIAKKAGDLKEMNKIQDAMTATIDNINNLMSNDKRIQDCEQRGAIKAILAATDGMALQTQAQEAVLDMMLNTLGEDQKKGGKLLKEQTKDEMLEHILNAIKSGKIPDDPDVAKKLAQAMALLGQDVERQEAMTKAGGVDYLLKMLQQHKNDKDVVRDTLKALSLAVETSQDGMERFIKAGGEDQLMKLKALHRDDETITSPIDNILGMSRLHREGKMTFKAQQRQQAPQAQVKVLTAEEKRHAELIENILNYLARFDSLTAAEQQAMLRHLLELIATGKAPADPEHAKKIALAMCMLATDEDIEKQIVAAGGVEFLMDMINKHKDDIGVVKQALEALELALMTTEGIEKFLKLGGEQWLENLKQYYTNTNPQPELVEMINNLLNMCKEHIQAVLHNEDPRERQYRNGLIQEILKAMKMFDQLSPQQMATLLDTLLKLIATGKSPDDPQHAQQIALAMCMIASDEDIERAIVEAGGVEFLMDMINKHKENEAVVKQALEALELALMTKEGIEKFLKLGGEEWLRNLRELWKDNKEICDMIDNLLKMCHEYVNGVGVNAKRLYETPQQNAQRQALIDSILAAMKKFDSLTQNQVQNTFDMMLRLCATTIAPEDTQQAQQIALAMCMLATDEDLEKQIVQSDGVEFLIDLINQHQHDEDVVKQALEALELALMTNEGMDKFLQLNGEEWLKNLRELWKDNAEICSMIDNLLRMCREYKHGQEVLAAQRGANQQNGAYGTADGGMNGQLNDMYSMMGALSGGHNNNNQRRQGMNGLDLEDGTQRRQGMNGLNLEDGDNMVQGLDILNQLRSFGLGAGLGAEQSGQPLGHMSQQQPNDMISNMFQNFNNMAGLNNHDPYAQQTSLLTTTELTQYPADDQDQHAQHLIQTINQVQMFITERRAAKLLSLFETLSIQERSYDRDYLLNAVLDGLAAICEEGFLSEQQVEEERERYMQQNPDYDPYMIPINKELQQYLTPIGQSIVLNELEQGVIENRVGQRLCERILMCPLNEVLQEQQQPLLNEQDQAISELDIAVLTDNFATLLSLITRPYVEYVRTECQLNPQIEPNVETDDEPYRCSNAHLTAHQKQQVIAFAQQLLDGAYQDLMDRREMEKQQAALQRQFEIERMKKLTQVTISAENQMVLDRIEKARAEAAAKAEQVKIDMQERIEKARREQEEKIRKMNEEAENKRQRQIEEILGAARVATLAKIDLEKRLAEGEISAPGGGTRGQVMKKLDEKAKAFLISGQLVTKHNDVNGPSARRLYVTSNMEYIVYNHAGSTEVKPTQRMKLTKFTGIKQGPLCKELESFRKKDLKRQEKEFQRQQEAKETGVPVFETMEDDGDGDDDERIDLFEYGRKQTVAPGQYKNRQTVAGRQTIAASAANAANRKGSMINLPGEEHDPDDDLPSQYINSQYFVLTGFDSKGRQRDVGFEAENPAQCRKIVRAYTRLHTYAQSINEFQGADTMQMSSNPLFNITTAEQGLDEMVRKEAENNERIKEWKIRNKIISPGQNQTFEDLLGDDDPWKE